MIARLFLVSFCFHFAQAGSLRGILDSFGPARYLQSDTVRDFVPLSCNSNLPPASQCRSFSKTFGDDKTYRGTTTIPCGECYRMDVTEAAITFGLLNIEGKLIFPEGYRLHVSASMVVVQGELEISASSKIVDGIPSVTFELIRENDDQFFIPAGENARACSGQRECNVGKKAFVVAGGNININGIPKKSPTWTRIYDVSSVNGNEATGLIVDYRVMYGWGLGSDILVTSHTKEWDNHQERKIVNMKAASVRGYVELVLDSPIKIPTTIVDDPNFATEVALLSRNIVFKGGKDSTEWHGGHFVVMNTPGVSQILQGVDFQNFGQQGKLGRYPIHFHFCKNSKGSVVRKNTIRHSNQRCVVVHGTDELLVEENIAYNTAGHCFLTEDGIEKHNRFISNLGAKTFPPEYVIKPYASANNGKETDYDSATFWITNPTNHFEGNVAAGSFSSGFWIEPLLRGIRASNFPGLNPMREPLGSFINNVAHSNRGKSGSLRMYTPGFLPNEIATIEGFRSYRNTKGIFVHKDYNIVITNSIFADNHLGVDVDRAEGVTIVDSMIIGESASYRRLKTRDNQVPGICHRNTLIGLDVHTWKLHKEFHGLTVENVVFEGFEKDLCPKTYAIHVDPHNLKQGLFELFTSFRNTRFDSETSKEFNFCTAKDSSGVANAYLVDLDGALKPPSALMPTAPSTLMTDDPTMLKFVDKSRCETVQGGCYTYCANTCFRSVRYQVDGPSTLNYMLKVCRRDDPSLCTLFAGGKRETTNRGSELAPRTFIAHLPTGHMYDAVFLDSSGTETNLPYLLEQYEENLCGESSGAFEVKVLDQSTNPPRISATSRDSHCQNLILNSDMEAPETYWAYSSLFGSLKATQGFKSQSALQYESRFRNGSYISYKSKGNMDFSCVTSASKWLLSAQVRLVETKTNKGVWCDITNGCPEVSVLVYGADGALVSEVRSRNYSGREWKPDDFNKITTTLLLSQFDGSVSDVVVKFDGYDLTWGLVFDDFAISPLE